MSEVDALGSTCGEYVETADVGMADSGGKVYVIDVGDSSWDV